MYMYIYVYIYMYVYVSPSKIQHSLFHENPPQNNSPAQPQETTVTTTAKSSGQMDGILMGHPKYLQVMDSDDENDENGLKRGKNMKMMGKWWENDGCLVKSKNFVASFKPPTTILSSPTESCFKTRTVLGMGLGPHLSRSQMQSLSRWHGCQISHLTATGIALCLFARWVHWVSLGASACDWCSLAPDFRVVPSIQPVSTGEKQRSIAATAPRFERGPNPPTNADFDQELSTFRPNLTLWVSSNVKISFLIFTFLLGSLFQEIFRCIMKDFFSSHAVQESTIHGV